MSTSIYDKNLLCMLCGTELEHTLRDVVHGDFRIRCYCGFDCYIEDSHYGKH